MFKKSVLAASILISTMALSGCGVFFEANTHTLTKSNQATVASVWEDYFGERDDEFMQSRYQPSDGSKVYYQVEEMIAFLDTLDAIDTTNVNITDSYKFSSGEDLRKWMDESATELVNAGIYDQVKAVSNIKYYEDSVVDGFSYSYRTGANGLFDDGERESTQSVIAWVLSDPAYVEKFAVLMTYTQVVAPYNQTGVAFEPAENFYQTEFIPADISMAKNGDDLLHFAVINTKKISTTKTYVVAYRANDGLKAVAFYESPETVGVQIQSMNPEDYTMEQPSK